MLCFVGFILLIPLPIYSPHATIGDFARFPLHAFTPHSSVYTTTQTFSAVVMVTMLLLPTQPWMIEISFCRARLVMRF
ncbi:hypothetical protein BC829DRAFT_387294, partial [Chytridium lagenaria]